MTVTDDAPTKMVVRRLPPKLTEEEFMEIVAPLPEHSYFRFCSPDSTLGNLAPSRVYITFCNLDALLQFKERFDNYVFVDSEGNESCAIVEFAICQSIATVKEFAKAKKDKRQNTLGEDPDYKAFIESLKFKSISAESKDDSETKKTNWEILLEEIQAKEAAVNKSQELVTPLLTYVRQRDKETRHKASFDDYFPLRGHKYGRNRMGSPFSFTFTSGTKEGNRSGSGGGGGHHQTGRGKHDSTGNSTSRGQQHHNRNRKLRSEGDVVGGGGGGVSREARHPRGREERLGKSQAVGGDFNEMSKAAVKIATSTTSSGNGPDHSPRWPNSYAQGRSGKSRGGAPTTRSTAGKGVTQGQRGDYYMKEKGSASHSRPANSAPSDCHSSERSSRGRSTN